MIVESESADTHKSMNTFQGSVTKRFDAQQTQEGQSTYVASIVKNNLNDWKTCVDYPLALFWNESRPSQFFVENLAEPDEKRVMIQLKQGRFLAFDQVVMSK